MRTLYIFIVTLIAAATAQLMGPTGGSTGGSIPPIPTLPSLPGGSAGGVMAANPMNQMLMYQMAMADHSSMSLPVMSMLQRNPAMMSNPMGAFTIANLLGVDLHKIMGPMAMASGSRNPAALLRWLPFASGDPSMSSILLMQGLNQGGGMGIGMGMVPYMAMLNA